MSYIVMLQLPGVTREAFEKTAGDNADTMSGLSERSREMGAVSHAFCEGQNGDMVVIDEWDSPESFKKFFESESDKIGPMMQQAGATGEPQPSFYEKVDSADAF